jgi:hypothetical protein
VSVGIYRSRNGKIDFVVRYLHARPVVYFNDGSGRDFTPVPFGDDHGAPYGIAFGDIDKDGWPDEAANVDYFSSGVPGQR